MNWILLANSFFLASVATVLALVIGFIMAVVMTAVSGRPRSILLGFTIVVLALPSFLVVNCWIDLLGVNGLLHRWLPLNIFSLTGAVLILALLLWPIPALAIWSAWQKLEPAHFEVDAALAGAKVFRFLLLPAAKSHLVISVAVVFALALNNFAVPIILQIKVFTSEMWVKFSTNLDPLGALQLSGPLLVVPICLLLLAPGIQTPWPRPTGTEISESFRRQLGSQWIHVASIAASIAVFLSLVVPLVQLAGTPRTWVEFLPALIAGRNAVMNSLLYAGVAALSAVLMAIIFTRRRSLSALWAFFLVPGILLSIGALTAFHFPMFDFFSRTAAIVITVLVVRYMAIAHSITRVAFQGLDRDLIDAGCLDGLRGVNLFRKIVFPQVAPELAAAACFVYVLCLWDVETILLVIPPGGETLAVRVFNLLHYGHNAHVNALCLLLLLLAVAPMLVFAVCKAVKRT